MVRECNLGKRGLGLPGRQDWEKGGVRVPSFLLFLRFLPLDPSALLWPMAFHSYVIAVPNSCRAKSHGLQ